MEHDRQVAFRLSSSLVEEIDARAEEWRSIAPGMRVTRADVVRAILVEALESRDRLERKETTVIQARSIEEPGNVQKKSVSPSTVQSVEVHPENRGSTGLCWLAS